MRVFTTQFRGGMDSLIRRLLRLRSARENVGATGHTIAKARSPVRRTTTAGGAGLRAPRTFLE